MGRIELPHKAGSGTRFPRTEPGPLLRSPLVRGRVMACGYGVPSKNTPTARLWIGVTAQVSRYRSVER